MCLASWRQVALLKLGLVIASLTLFPWKQPAGQLVPISLGPSGASAWTGCRTGPLSGSWEGGPNAPWSLSLPTSIEAV